MKTTNNFTRGLNSSSAFKVKRGLNMHGKRRYRGSPVDPAALAPTPEMDNSPIRVQNWVRQFRRIFGI